MKYEVVMGLEVHVELATNSKLFCSCSAKFGAQPNEHVCPACAGMPGMLPVTNKQAVSLGIAAALVTNSVITHEMRFDKKNYFYPDLSTGYQITQLFAPICTNGYLDIETPQGERRITLKQIHIEEDAGKLVHDTRTDSSLVDYNRASVPLVEIVSNPDFRTAQEVIAYLEKLRDLLVYAGVSDCKMQEGSMRCDVNLSVREMGAEQYGVRTEMKNLNSLRAISRAIAYESQRHIDALETGCETLVQETRRWDDDKGESFAMREKEDATDYRYFPNPDLMPVLIDEAWIARVRQSLPELPDAKRTRYREQLGLADYDIGILTGDIHLAALFETACAVCGQPKDAANWVIVDVLKLLNDSGQQPEDLRFDAAYLGKIIQMVNRGQINRGTGKKVLQKVFAENVEPEEYVRSQSLGLMTDSTAIRETVLAVITQNEKSVTEYRGGKTQAFQYLIGQSMRALRGQASAQEVQNILHELLDEKN